MSEGDRLAGVRILQAEVSHQALRPEYGEKRHEIWGTGVGFAFHRRRLNFAPLSAVKDADCGPLLQPFFSTPLGAIGAAILETTDADAWDSVLKRLLRQSLSYALAAKGTSNAGMVVRGTRVIDTSGNPDASGPGIRVFAGVELKRIYRAADGRVMFTLSPDFQAVDPTGAFVTDPTRTAGLYQKCRRQAPDNCWATTERILRKLLPLEVRLSNCALLLKTPHVPIFQGESR